MDRIRSFFEDLGFVLDEELVGKSGTDSDKSSDYSDDKTTNEHIIKDTQDAVNASPSFGVANLVRRPSFKFRNPTSTELQRQQQQQQQCPDATRDISSPSTIGLKRVANSIVEEINDENHSNKEEDDDPTIPRKKARSFTRFHFVRSTSRSMDIIHPTLHDKQSKNITNNNNNINDTKIVTKTMHSDSNDDGALDNTPTNLFGYACGIEFCSSMELMNKIQGIDPQDTEDDDDDDDNNNNEDNVVVANASMATNDVNPTTATTKSVKKENKIRKSIKNAMKSIHTKKKNSTSIIPSPNDTTPTVASESTAGTKQQHMRRWGHSMVWTIIALLFAYSGCVCAIMTRQSIHFATLRQPLIITELYQPITHIGMIRIQICTNTTTAIPSTGTIDSLSEANDDTYLTNTTSTTTTTTTMTTSTNDASECNITRLSREEVSDKLFNLSRSLLTLGTYFGIALTLVLTTSIIWESINLRPLAIGYLFAYFFQSFSLLFFNTELCIEYKCQISTGGYLSILTSICWIGTLISIVRMDIYKYQSIRLRQRERRKAKLEARRQQRKVMIKKQQQDRNEMMIINNFQNCSQTTESVDALDIEAVFTSEEESHPQQNQQGMKRMTL